MKRAVSLLLFVFALTFSLGVRAELPVPDFPLQSRPLTGKDLVLKTRVKVTNGNSFGTGVVICPRNKDGSWLILTALHVTSNHEGYWKTPTTFIITKYVPVKTVSITLENDKTCKADVISYDHQGDVSWLRTQDKDLDLTCANLARKSPKIGSRLRHKGLGGDQWRTGTVSHPFAFGKQVLSITALRGDSGGGVFQQDTDEVIGILSTSNLVDEASAGSCETAWRVRPIDNKLSKRENKTVLPPLQH